MDEDYQSDARKLDRWLAIIRLKWAGRDICIVATEI